MIDEVTSLRERVHRGDFRFVLTPEHWKVLYVPENLERSNLAVVRKDEKLKGYAAFYVVNFAGVRAYDVRELCAENEDVLAQLIDEITLKGMNDKVDFIFLKRCGEPYNDVLAKKGFASFLESVIMVALFNPRELLFSLSQPVENGPVIKLSVKGFDPISIRVGTKGIAVVDKELSRSTVSTDNRTFLKLFFGRSSFQKEFLSRRIKISGVFGLTTVNRFFKLIRHDKWYIPMGDWV